MEIQNILTLIQAFTEHSLTELHVEDGGVKVCLKREPGTVPCEGGAAAVSSVLTKGTAGGPAAGGTPEVSAANKGAQSPVVPAPAAMVSEGLTAVSGGDISSDKVVVSPLVGIFYSAPSPEAHSFVEVGDRVKKGQVLGIIEAMKLMNEIESEYDGVVEAILVNNEDVVEYGQPLFRIR